MILDLRVSPVFLANQQAKHKIVINQGGTRSGKTYSILQLILLYCFQHKGHIVDIVRKTQAELWSTALLDWIEILQSTGVYNEKYHHKTKNEFWINGNLVRFMGLDKSQKKRGSKRHLLYINEANGITLEDWAQLKMRCMGKIYLDYNPSEYFWLNEQVLEKRQGEFDFIKSTYLDNYDFLTPDNIREIEDLITMDDYYHKVYVLGELAVMKGKIYEKYDFISPDEYDAIESDDTFYGLDFGYDHPMALMEIKYYNERVFERQKFVERKKTDEDLIKSMDEQNISQLADIYADPAGASSIFKIQEAGYNVRRAKKQVQEGIRFCQQLRRTICSDSLDHIKMMNQYKWKQTADGVVLAEPVKINDDTPDATRYGEFTHLRKLAA
jgi:phage terminase large subunit